MSTRAAKSIAFMRRPPSPPAGWQSVRPWMPRLSLTVKEITPVSVTFVLSCASPVNLSDEDFVDETGTSSDHRAGPSRPREIIERPPSISEYLGKGLAVKVNDAPWQRVVMHIDDDMDDAALVILYGLLAAREYEIELAVAAGEDSIRGKVTTEPPNSRGATDPINSTVCADNVHADASGLDADLMDEDHPTRRIVQPLTPAATRPGTPTSDSAASRQLTVEERASHLLHELTALGSEKEALVTRLKAGRKESQRADHALRNEIEALKRASERAAQADQRSRQRFLALQEATKQLLAASVEADEQVKLVEGSLPQLEERVRTIENEYQEVQKEAAKSRSQVQEALKSDKRRVLEMEAELTSLNHRLEKLSTKRDKLVVNTVPELEERLSQLGREIEEVERLNQSREIPLEGEDSNQTLRLPITTIHQPSPGSTNVAPPGFPPHNNAPRQIQPIGRPSNLIASSPPHHISRQSMSSQSY